jgi:quercetin dioxygenase-like cupin family protein
MGIVLEGKIDLIINGHKYTYQKGDRYFIPKNIPAKFMLGMLTLPF